MEEGMKRQQGRCPLSGIPCSECGYPATHCPLYLLAEAIQDIARALENNE